MQPYLFVTTFNKAGYEQYGRTMVETFLTNWPETFNIQVYVEGFDLVPKQAQNPRLIAKELTKVTPLMEFKARHRNDMRAHGYYPEGNKQKFQFDAVRFSHKIYALADAYTSVAENNQCMVWLDGDTITFRKVPDTFLEEIAPIYYFNSAGRQPYGVTYLGRLKQHSECGFVTYNSRHPMMNDFWREFIALYDTDRLFELKEWHDSFLFDHVRMNYEGKGMINNNLTPKFNTGHPFVNSRLGEYMDHMKGSRKATGRSRKNERFMRTANEPNWWK